MKKLKVAFICVHNSCRSQMAEAITKILASDVFDAYSAGTEIKSGINPQAVTTIKNLYHYDMTLLQKPKLISELPKIDIVITMGCNVVCPYVPCIHKEDWGLEDPTGKPALEFERLAKVIENKVKDLMVRAKSF